jgi:segregation and condensation protein B
MEKPRLKSVLESLLFVSGEPVAINRLVKICNTPKNEIEAALTEINEGYQKSDSGLFIVRKGGSLQLATNPKNSEYVVQMVSGELGGELSRSALETLSIIAYRGPVTRVQVEAIRGVNCSYVIRSLLMKGLVERKEASDIRGYLYEISFDFLKSLGISGAEDLPDWKNLSKNEKVEQLLENDGASQGLEENGDTQN